MRSCKKLRSLPTSIKLKSLQVFNLNYCSQLEMFPEIEGDMGCLRNLNLNGTAIKDLPSSFEYLNGLYSLDLSDCRKLESIPSIIWKLRSLQRLDLRDCLKLEKFSEIEGDVDYLHELLLSGSAIKDIPPSIQRLNGLWNFELNYCEKLESLPNNICKLKSLRYLTIRGCTKIKKFPEMSREMKGLRELDLGETSIKQLPASIGQLNNLLELNLSGLQLEESSFLGLCSLRVLNLSNCNLLDGSILNSVGCLSSLEVLNLSGNNFASLPASLNQLTKLRRIHLEYCSRLQVLTSLPSSITKFLWNREPI
uniref:Putative TMV resistance protein N-like n=1 Tax=Davidia involucrata TaxID=16924 RepID=A0A5B6ZXI7_DAVIN